MRVRPMCVIQVVVTIVVILSFLALFTSDDGDLVIPQGGKIYKNLRSLVKEDDGEKKWDPFGLGWGAENAHQENIVFHADQNRGQQVRIQTCDPVLSFGFVKTHKAGSTTLISVLQRFGYRHNLNFALPKRGDVFAGWPYTLMPKKHLLPLQNGMMNFNVLVNHAIFNKTIFDAILDNPHYIGVVRSPLTHVKSVMNYFQKMLIPEDEKGKYTMMERIIRFADNPEYYDGINDRMKNTKDPSFHVRSVTKNFQSADFGLPRADMEVPAKVDAFLDELHKTFPFLLVMEYMHESLLLLKRRWCWQVNDILFLQKNVFKYENKEDPIPPQTAAKLLQWSSADVKLYDVANKTLWTEIAKETDFYSELSHYKTVNNLVGAFCKANVYILRAKMPPRFQMPPLEIAASQWNQALTVTLSDCKDLMRFEMAFTRLLQIKQRPDLYDDEYYFRTADGILKSPKNSPPPPAAAKQPQKIAIGGDNLREKLMAAGQKPPQN